MTIQTPATARWRKSTRCGTVNCVEVATVDDGFAVRDSKDLTGPTLGFDPTAWTDFTTALKRGGFSPE
jgi:hypothetical protein